MFLPTGNCKVLDLQLWADLEKQGIGNWGWTRLVQTYHLMFPQIGKLNYYHIVFDGSMDRYQGYR